MSLIKLDGIGDIREAVVAPEGMYNLQCIKWSDKETEKGKMINLIFHIDEDGDYANVFDTVSLPGPNDDREKVAFKLLMIKRRLFWLGLTDAIESGEIEPQDFVGCSTQIPCKLVQEEYEGRIKNVIQWPQLPTEE